MHQHSHHNHAAADSGRAQRRRLAATLAISVVYMLAEAIGGWWSNSLALLADAGHMLSDVAALGLSLFAVWIRDRSGSSQRTFGYQRAEVLSALVNGSILVAVALGILHEAWGRFAQPAVIDTVIMLPVAVGGLVVNLVGLWLLQHGRHDNLNIRGAWLHMLGDALGSLGVIVAGLGLRLFGWSWIDPLASVFISLLIVHSSWQLLAEAAGVLMENAPDSIDVEAVRQLLLRRPGVRDVHCLHVWRISSRLDSLSAHVVVEREQGNAGQGEQLDDLTAAVQQAFDIPHVTLQLEPPGFAPCAEHALESCESSPRGAVHGAADPFTADSGDGGAL